MDTALAVLSMLVAVAATVGPVLLAIWKTA